MNYEHVIELLTLIEFTRLLLSSFYNGISNIKVIYLLISELNYVVDRLFIKTSFYPRLRRVSVCQIFA